MHASSALQYFIFYSWRKNTEKIAFFYEKPVGKNLSITSFFIFRKNIKGTRTNCSKVQSTKLTQSSEKDYKVSSHCCIPSFKLGFSLCMIRQKSSLMKLKHSLCAISCPSNPYLNLLEKFSSPI
jgi:hypothetical protein